MTRSAVEKTDPSGTRLGELWSILPEEAGSDDTGRLVVGGVAVAELAERYGTPLHVIDESGLRRQMRRLADGLTARWPNSEVLFASKSLPIVEMYRVAHEEGLAIDVAGGGELQLALAGGVDPQRIYMHGNAKSEAELELALSSGVGTIIVDNEDELDRLDRLLTQPQRLLLRVIPGVEAETHASQATGGENSKFGVPLGELERVVARMQRHPLMEFEGIHLHIGSQILNTAEFAESVDRVSRIGRFPIYNVGGGLGVKYTYAEEAPTVEAYLDAVVAEAKAKLPADAKLMIEPGRSIVARAGVTLYRILSVKRAVKTFVAVDGGMADQLDIALTGQRYEALLADRLGEAWTETVQLVGRQCESGDLLVDGAPMPAARVGDLVVLASTGAYSYSMTNNYNGALRPAIVFVHDGTARLVTRRETYEDLLALHAPSISAA
ncbi:diaminopimelate decarboxylase [Leucobacter sp. L43]|uniref:diaminopimelate decarboxylase n=1 Tax=Leucobacter sp. L43 TaxID=2798040 RepID=UPI0019076A2E|nr:diaminopimelate decarboxylase [Leucobacter sp. L43]